MSMQSAPYYWFECDEPGCGIKSTECGEHSAWSDVDGAWADADGLDWIEVEGKHYCDDHAAKHDPDLQEETSE